MDRGSLIREPGDAFAQGPRVPRREQPPRLPVPHDLRDASDVCRDERRAAGHGLEGREGAALEVAREGDGIGGMVEGGHVLVGDAAEELVPLGRDPEARGELPPGLRVARARDAHPHPLRHEADGTEERAESFLHEEAARVEQGEAGLRAARLGRRGPRPAVRAEQLRVDRVGHHPAVPRPEPVRRQGLVADPSRDEDQGRGIAEVAPLDHPEQVPMPDHGPLDVLGPPAGARLQGAGHLRIEGRVDGDHPARVHGAEPGEQIRHLGVVAVDDVEAVVPRETGQVLPDGHLEPDRARARVAPRARGKRVDLNAVQARESLQGERRIRGDHVDLGPLGQASGQVVRVGPDAAPGGEELRSQ